MNRNPAYPDDGNPPVDDPLDAPRQKDIERRLKQARPRPPALDVEAIVRSALDEARALGYAPGEIAEVFQEELTHWQEENGGKHQ